jgi:hypothetical protein
VVGGAGATDAAGLATVAAGAEVAGVVAGGLFDVQPAMRIVAAINTDRITRYFLVSIQHTKCREGKRIMI